MGVESSGTSAVAGVLHHLGVYMGARLHAPSKGNPKGYYEDNDWIDLHIREDFWANQRHFIEQYVDKRLSQGKKIWGVKSPMFAAAKMGVLFASILKEKIHDLDLMLVVVRRPLYSITKSAYTKRKGTISHEKAYSQTKNSVKNLNAVVNAIDCPKLEIEYDRLCFYTKDEVKRMVEFCFGGMSFPLDGVRLAVEFVDLSLNHYPVKP